MESRHENNITDDRLKREEYIISVEKANIVALIYIVPVTLIYALPYYVIWEENIFGGLRWINLGIFLASIPFGIIVHELLHGLTWAIFLPSGFKSISYGIRWEYLMPYCHSSCPVKVWQYLMVGLMPLLIMGIAPAIYALIAGNKPVMFFALFFTWASGGDIQIVWMLRKFKKNQMVIDHPVDPGFFLLKD